MLLLERCDFLLSTPESDDVIVLNLSKYPAAFIVCETLYAIDYIYLFTENSKGWDRCLIG